MSCIVNKFECVRRGAVQWGPSWTSLNMSAGPIWQREGAGAGPGLGEAGLGSCVETHPGNRQTDRMTDWQIDMTENITFPQFHYCFYNQEIISSSSRTVSRHKKPRSYLHGSPIWWFTVVRHAHVCVRTIAVFWCLHRNIFAKLCIGRWPKNNWIRSENSERLRLSLGYLVEIEEWIQSIPKLTVSCYTWYGRFNYWLIPVGNSVYFVLFLSWDFWQDKGNLAIDCIHSSISVKYLKLNLSLITITSLKSREGLFGFLT